MAEVVDARAAEEIVLSKYRNPMGMQAHSFRTHKQGFTWIVEFECGGLAAGRQKHRWHINAKNGNVIRKQ